LRPNPKKRIGNKIGIKEIKSHKFFNKFNWDFAAEGKLKMPKIRDFKIEQEIFSPDSDTDSDDPEIYSPSQLKQNQDDSYF
jgi:hypothetical protein